MSEGEAVANEVDERASERRRSRANEVAKAKPCNEVAKAKP